jgi:hypothetical protein
VTADLPGILPQLLLQTYLEYFLRISDDAADLLYLEYFLSCCSKQTYLEYFLCCDSRPTREILYFLCCDSRPTIGILYFLCWHSKPTIGILYLLSLLAQQTYNWNTVLTSSAGTANLQLE